MIAGRGNGAPIWMPMRRSPPDAGERSAVRPATANVAIADNLTNPLMAAPFVEFTVAVQGQCQTTRTECLALTRTSRCRGAPMPVVNAAPRHHGDTSQEGCTR